VHLSWKPEKGEFQLNYSKRVNRPDGDELNPFPEYQDPYNLRAGNPSLLPEFIHSFELGYKMENNQLTFVPSVYYRYTVNGFTSVTKPLNDSVLLTTEENLAKAHTGGLELVLSVKAARIFTANLASNFFYNKIDASNLVISGDRDIISMSSNFNANFTITPNTLLQVTSNYRSARLTAQGKSFARFNLNAGIRQELFRKKLSLILAVSDVFKSQRQKNELNSPFFKQVSVGRRDQRVIFFGLSYRLGGLKQKNAGQELEFDDTL
jgi:outer membrane receptor protein involved in Fe transport